MIKKRSLNMKGRLVTVDEHIFEPKPTPEESSFSNSSFSEIYPLSGPSLENHRKFSDKGFFKYQEEVAKIQKEENDLFTVGLGGGEDNNCSDPSF